MSYKKSLFFKTEQEVYDYIIAEIEDIEADEETKTGLKSVVYDCLEDNKTAVHYGLSPSKSPGWFECAAYIDRAKAWDGSKEPAVRGTIAHYILSQELKYLQLAHNADMGADSEDHYKHLSRMSFIYLYPELITEAGLQSVRTGINFAYQKLLETKVKWWSEVTSVRPDICTKGSRNLILGGSIDMLHVTKDRLIVIDLKTGKNPVQCESPQLRCYALLAAMNVEKITNGDCSQESVWSKDFVYEVGICQFGKITTKEYTSSEMMEFKDKLNCQVALIGEYYKEGLNMIEEKNFFNVSRRYPKLFCENKLCRFCKGCFCLEKL